VVLNQSNSFNSIVEQYVLWFINRMNLHFREEVWECHFSAVKTKESQEGGEPVGAGFAMGGAPFRAVKGKPFPFRKGKEGQLRGSGATVMRFKGPEGWVFVSIGKRSMSAYGGKDL
jgi:hypothetical protein